MHPQIKLKDPEFRIYDKTSSDLDKLFLDVEDVLKSLNNQDYLSLCALRYGDRESIPITEFIERVKSSEVFIGLYLDNILVGYGELYPPKGDNLSEFSYLVFPKHQGKGYGNILAERLLMSGVGNKNYSGVFAQCVVTNIASLKLLKKLNLNYPANEIFKNRKYEPPAKVYLWRSTV